jgi:hypothetical protein
MNRHANAFPTRQVCGDALGTLYHWMIVGNGETVFRKASR